MTPMKWFWGFLRKYRFKLLGGLILTNFEVHDFKVNRDAFDAFYYGQDFGYNHANAILGVGWKDGEV